MLTTSKTASFKMRESILFHLAWNVVSLLCMCTIVCNSQLNIHMKPKVFKSDNAKNSFFGASLSLNDDAIYVGAPKYEKHGGVFHCNLDGTGCSAVNGFTRMCAR